MDNDEAIKYTIMLAVLYFIIPGGGNSELAGLLELLAILIVIILMILVAITQIKYITVVIPDRLLNAALWIGTLVITVCILLITLLVRL